MDQELKLLEWLLDANIASLFKFEREKFEEALSQWILLVENNWSRTYNYVYLLKAFKAQLFAMGITTENERIWQLLKQPLAHYVELEDDGEAPPTPFDLLMQCETKLSVSQILMLGRSLDRQRKWDFEAYQKRIEKENIIAAGLRTNEGKAALVEAMINPLKQGYKISKEKMTEYKEQATELNKAYFSNPENLNKFANDMAAFGYDSEKIKANIKRNLKIA